MTLNPNSKKWQLQFDVIYELMAEELNNEESVGNATRSRTQTDQEGNVRNKISGPNTKHNIMAKLYQLTDDKSQLCKTCRVISPMRNGELAVDEADVDTLSASGKRTKGCAMCDAGGFLNAEKGKTEKRESVFNVSDAIAEVSGTRQREMHSRLDTVESATKAKADGEDGSTNMIFYSENRNSTYHQSVVIDLDRIGFDDHHQLYILSDDELKARITAVVKATMHHYMDIKGAKMATHKPHMISLSGTVREITDSQAVNVNYSSMAEDYMDVHAYFNKDTKVFNNPKEWQEVINGLLDDETMRAIIERNRAVVASWSA